VNWKFLIQQNNVLKIITVQFYDVIFCKIKQIGIWNEMPCNRDIIRLFFGSKRSDGNYKRIIYLRVVLKTMILSFLRMQESPVYAVYEIPACAGMTVFRTTLKEMNKHNKQLIPLIS